MIHVNRSAVKPPPALGSAAVRAARKEAAKAFAPHAPAELSDRHQFKKALYLNPEVAKSLQLLFKNKCAYCESKLSATGFAEVDHFRPKTRAMSLDGQMSPRHYWWLVYEWENIYLSCMTCNRMKSVRFPVRAAERARAGAKGAELIKERALLLDPCLDHPERHLSFLDGGEIASDTDEGKATIEIVGLNRAGLVEARRETFDTLKAALHARLAGEPGGPLDEGGALWNLLASETSAGREYAALRRQVVRRWLSESKLAGWEKLFDGGAGRPKEHTRATAAAAAAEFQEHARRQAGYSVEVQSKQQKETYFAGAKRIERIEIRNFKAVERLELKFPPPPEQGGEAWLALLGENAVGKSSILKAVALALMGERHANELGLDARQFVRRKARGGAGEVKVYLTNIPEPVTLSFTTRSRNFRVEPSEPKVLLLGYGATRLLPADTKEKGTTEKYIRIKNLFVPTAPLSDAQRWLGDTKRLPDAKFKSVAASLRKLLMLDPATPVRRRNGRVTVTTPDGPVPLQDLSDGFQSVIALCADVMIGLLQRWPEVEAAEGIVLLDEIEAHLHPSWKIEIVRLLREVFPRVAFIISTHDPLCLKGLSQDEIVVLRRNEARRVYASREVPAVEDLRADQLLTSPLFGLYSTRGRTPGDLPRYPELLGKGSRTRDEERELQTLRRRLGDTLCTAETPLGKRAKAVVEQKLSKGSAREIVALVAPAGDGGAAAPAAKARAGAKDAAAGADDAALRAEIKVQLARLLKK